MQTFQITNGPPTGPKNYVFVDEHNRHKRLKVMRACEGCRRRKIKCDAATTNTWPCAACKRLKLPCVPPAGGLDCDQNGNDDPNMAQQPDKSVHQPIPGAYDPYAQFQGPPVQNVTNFSSDDMIHATHQGFLQDAYHFVPPHHLPNVQTMNDSYTQRFGSLEASESGVMSQHSRASPKTPDNHTAETLSEQLGELRIGENGVAPYLRQQKPNAEPDGPIQEIEIELPPLSTAAGSQIRIPPPLMPDDEDAKDLFKIFFENVHPYVPVLCRSQFYHQWQTDRQGISPLLLEAIFACAGRVSGEPVEESPWLALGNSTYLT